MDVNKLWQNFADTVQNHYLDFEGRVGRSQFWYYVLVNIVVGILVDIVAGLTGLGLLRTIYSLGLLLPSLGITARRLHDVGKPTSWIYLLAIPFLLEILLGIVAAGGMFFAGPLLLFANFVMLINLLVLVAVIAIIYFCAQPGIDGPNEYGPPPPVFTPN
ncbi:MAG TPA: DUF805 domain-containing protein [Rhizomicrobium sp.]|nr:DUF805 domain-containing protein [Rhizomicrobium sp.]